MALSPSPTRAELCLLCHTGTLPKGTQAALSTGHRPREPQRGTGDLQDVSPLQVSEAGRGPGGAARPVPRAGAAHGSGSMTGNRYFCPTYLSSRHGKPQGQRPGTDPRASSPTGSPNEAECPESPRKAGVGAAAAAVWGHLTALAKSGSGSPEQSSCQAGTAG